MDKAKIITWLEVEDEQEVYCPNCNSFHHHYRIHCTGCSEYIFATSDDGLVIVVDKKGELKT